MSIPIVNHSIKYNPSLDGLRGIAILLVILFHIWPEYFSFGYIGVDIFFVLSGYLITQIIYKKLEQNTFSFKEFYRNRVRRIFPAMIIVLLVTFLIGYLFLFPHELQQLGKHIKSSAFFYQNFRLIDEVGYWDEEAQLKPLLHFWSLSIEEQFYIFWPFLIFTIYRLKIHFLLSLFIIFIILLSLPILLDIHPFYHSLARFWELSFGGLTYAFRHHFKLSNTTKRLQWGISILFFFSIALSADNTVFNLTKTAIIVIATGSTIILLSIQPHQKLFSIKPLVILGLISFPLYLWHYVFISYMHIFNLSIKSFGIWIILASILISYLTYRYIELYARKQTSYRFATILFLLVLFIGLAGQYTYQHKGFPKRSHLLTKKSIELSKKPPNTNKNGISLTTDVLGYMPSNNYIKATSTDMTKNFILIVGDSHAFAAYHGFANIFKKKGLETVLLANSGCPPYIGGQRGENPNKCQQCKRKIKTIYEIINTKKIKIKKVLFITRGTVYYYNQEFGDTAKPLQAHFCSYYLNPTQHNSKKEFIKMIEDTFQYFNKLSHIEVYYLLENPELGFHPKNCKTRPFSILPIRCKNLSRNQYMQRSKEFRNIIFKIAKQYSKIKLLDPKDLFFSQENCKIYKDNTFLYLDDDHLSPEGSLYQANGLASKILED